MNISKISTLKTTWLKQEQQALPSKLWQRCYVVPRQFYKQTEKKVSVSGPDLWRVIRNERKVLLQSYPAVLWSLKQNGTQKYIEFYCIRKQYQQQIPAKTALLLPETLLLRLTLQAGILYKVKSDTQYWAFLNTHGQLHTTDVAGIMGNAHYFLDAMGVKESLAPVDFDVQALQEINLKSFPLLALPGLMHFQKTPEQQAQKNWLRTTLIATASAMVCAGVLSLGLIAYENHLTTKLSKLQREVMIFTEQQDKLATQSERLANYQTLFQRFTPVSITLSELGKDLSKNVDLMQIDISGQTVSISGSSDSATQVLEVLNQRPQWQGARFERSVQRSRQREDFSIAMTFIATEDALSSNSKAESP